MWWISINGNTKGPFSAAQLEKWAKLNMLRSLDRVSEDKVRWYYVKDTVFWKPATTIKEAPPVTLHTPRAKLRGCGGMDTSPSGPNIVRQGDSEFGSNCSTDSDRLSHDTPVERTTSNKALWFALVAITITVFLGIGALGCYMMHALAQRGEAKPVIKGSDAGNTKPVPSFPPPVSFNTVKSKLVIIECDDGSGSGFLLEMDGKVYLMTNEHVIRSAGAPRARLLDGTQLNLGAFSVATDRDLARFEVIGCSAQPFRLNNLLPNTGDMVAVYGNSLGSGVVTESKGFIQGVGSHRLETNAEIVPGNSGSPLVDPDGKVLGVAALVSRRGSDEWTVKNTRYEGTPRRFAIRFTNVSWKAIDRLRYEQQIAALKEYEVFWDYLLPYLCFDSTKVDEEKLIFNDMKGNDFKLKKYGYCEMLVSLTKAYKKRNKCRAQWSEQLRGRKKFVQRLVDNEVSEEDGKRAIAEYDHKVLELYEKAKEAFRNMILKRKEALINAQSVLAEGPWDAPQVLNGYSKDDRNGSVVWYREGVQYFMNLMNQKLKDLTKEIEAIENGDDDDEDE